MTLPTTRTAALRAALTFAMTIAACDRPAKSPAAATKGDTTRATAMRQIRADRLRPRPRRRRPRRVPFFADRKRHVPWNADGHEPVRKGARRAAADYRRQFAGAVHRRNPEPPAGPRLAARTVRRGPGHDPRRRAGGPRRRRTDRRRRRGRNGCHLRIITIVFNRKQLFEPVSSSGLFEANGSRRYLGVVAGDNDTVATVACYSLGKSNSAFIQTLRIPLQRRTHRQ